MYEHFFLFLLGGSVQARRRQIIFPKNQKKMLRTRCRVCRVSISLLREEIPILLKGVNRGTEVICAQCCAEFDKDAVASWSSCLVCNKILPQEKKDFLTPPSELLPYREVFFFRRLLERLRKGTKCSVRLRLSSKAVVYGCLCSLDCLHEVRLACKPLDRVQSCRICRCSYVDHSRLTCQNCKGMTYCSKICQKKNWNEHKGPCQKISNSLKKDNSFRIPDNLYCNLYFIIRNTIYITKGRMAKVTANILNRTLWMTIDQDGDLAEIPKCSNCNLYSNCLVKFYSFSSWSNLFGRYSGTWEELLKLFGEPSPYIETPGEDWWNSEFQNWNTDSQEVKRKEKIKLKKANKQTRRKRKQKKVELTTCKCFCFESKIPTLNGPIGAKIKTSSGFVGQDGVYLFKIDKEKYKHVYLNLKSNIDLYLVYLNQIHNVAFMCKGESGQLGSPYHVCLPEEVVQFSFLCSFLSDETNFLFQLPHSSRKINT